MAIWSMRCHMSVQPTASKLTILKSIDFGSESKMNDKKASNEMMPILGNGVYMKSYLVGLYEVVYS